MFVGANLMSECCDMVLNSVYEMTFILWLAIGNGRLYRKRLKRVVKELLLVELYCRVKVFQD